MSVRLLASVLLGTNLCVAAAIAADQESIFETVKSSSDRTILLSAIKEARFEFALSAKGENTLFAPSNAAFEKLSQAQLAALIDDKDLLRKIVAGHIVTGKALTKEDLKGLAGKEFNGFKIAIEDDSLWIGSAKITASDLKCSNGIVHGIDAVLIPK